MAKKRFVTKYGGIQAYGKERLDQFWHDGAVDNVSPNLGGPKEDLIKFQGEQKKKNKFNLIILFTTILSVSFLSVYFYGLTIQ